MENLKKFTQKLINDSDAINQYYIGSDVHQHSVVHDAKLQVEICQITEHAKNFGVSDDLD